jgi:hypothetical protein
VSALKRLIVKIEKNVLSVILVSKFGKAIRMLKMVSTDGNVYLLFILG